MNLQKDTKCKYGVTKILKILENISRSLKNNSNTHYYWGLTICTMLSGFYIPMARNRPVQTGQHALKPRS